MAAMSTDLGLDAMPVVRDVRDFDSRGGNLLERVVFNNRLAVVAVCAILTAVLGYFAATRLVLNASFERMIPQGQPSIRNYLEHKGDLRGLGNSLRIVVENEDGDIFDPRYLEALKRVSDEMALTPGVDRAWMKSLWMPAVRWTEVTEEGFRGGPVMPDAYDGSPRAVEQLRQNIARSGIVGSLVSSDFKSTMVFVPLLDRDAATGKPIDYRSLSRILDQEVRDANEGASTGPRIAVHTIGFAKVVGELIEGLAKVMAFFAAAAIVAVGVIYTYTRCPRSTALVIACSLVAVGLRARSLFDPGPVPRVRDRRVARRAEDERHHAGHRPRHAQARRRALHVPAPVPRGPHGARRRRRRLRRADGDRHPGDPRPRGDREHRRRGADRHQPVAPARAAFVCGRERGSRREEPCRGAGGIARPRPGQALGGARPLHHPPLGDRRDRRRDGACRFRTCRGKPPSHRRPGSGRARAARGLPLQPR